MKPVIQIFFFCLSFTVFSGLFSVAAEARCIVKYGREPIQGFGSCAGRSEIRCKAKPDVCSWDEGRGAEPSEADMKDADTDLDEK